MQQHKPKLHGLFIKPVSSHQICSNRFCSVIIISLSFKEY